MAKFVEDKSNFHEMSPLELPSAIILGLKENSFKLMNR